MEKPYTKIIGLPIVIEGIGKVARITDVLVDPKDGRVAAFFVNNGRMKVIAPIDILFFGQTITIGDREDIIDAHDLVKVQDVIKKDIRIFKSRVETKKGDYLGRVQNYFIDVKAFGLTKIAVHKSFLGVLKTPDLLIPARDIIEIKKGLVIVKNKYAAKRAEVKEEEERVRKLYPDLAS